MNQRNFRDISNLDKFFLGHNYTLFLTTLSALIPPALSGVIFGAGVKLGPALIRAGGIKADFFLENQKKRRYFFKLFNCLFMH